MVVFVHRVYSVKHMVKPKRRLAVVLVVVVIYYYVWVAVVLFINLHEFVFVKRMVYKKAVDVRTIFVQHGVVHVVVFVKKHENERVEVKTEFCEIISMNSFISLGSPPMVTVVGHPTTLTNQPR